MMSLIYDILKNSANEYIYKTEIGPKKQKTNVWLPKEKAGGGINQQRYAHYSIENV